MISALSISEYSGGDFDGDSGERLNVEIDLAQ
jgi:hypothetical protein